MSTVLLSERERAENRLLVRNWLGVRQLTRRMGVSQCVDFSIILSESTTPEYFCMEIVVWEECWNNFVLWCCVKDSMCVSDKDIRLLFERGLKNYNWSYKLGLIYYAHFRWERIMWGHPFDFQLGEILLKH